MLAHRRLFSILLLTLCATAAYGQATLTFTNTDSQALSALTAEGIVGGEQVDALNQTVGTLTPNGALGATYADANAELRATVALDGGQDLYRFIGTQECAGVIEVEWVDRQGNALEVLDARLVAAVAHADGGYQVQAVSTVTERTTGETFAVRGGGAVHVEASFALGADARGRAATHSRFFETQVACDQVVTLQVQASNGGAVVGSSDYGPAPADVQIPTRANARDMLDVIIAQPDSMGSTVGSQVAPLQLGAVNKMTTDPGATSICTTDTFDGPDLDPVWNFDFLGDADQGSATIVDNTLYLAGDGSSLFRGPDNGAFLSQTVIGDFRAEVVLIDRPINLGGSFAKGGLLVRPDTTDPAAPRVMVQLIFDHPTLNTTFLQFDYRDESGNSFEMASSPVDLDLPLSVAFDRRGDVFTVYFSTDNGATWLRPAGGMAQGQVTLDMGPSAEVGLAVASYLPDTEYTVQFDDFELCRRQNLPKVDPPPAPGCQSNLGTDLLFVLDSSGSMTAEFQGFPSKLEAAADAIAQTNALLAANFTDPRSALISFRGAVLSDPVFNLTQGAQVLAPITTDLDAVTAAAAAIDPSTIDVDANTPLPIALERTIDLLKGEAAANTRKVVALITDGAPNIDLAGRGASEYRFSEILPLSIRDDQGDFLRWDEVAWLGNYNGGIGTYDGEVFGNTLYLIEQVRAEVPDALIFPIAIEGEDTFYEDLLAYASFYYGTPLLRANDATSLADALQSVIRALDCGGSIGDLVWNDRNANGTPDRGEPGLAGVTVNLIDENGDIVATQVTDQFGLYLFTNVVPGTYTVEVDPSTLPADATDQTFDRDGLATPNSATVTVEASDEIRDVDFGYRGVATIGDFVWVDNNGDGVQDTDEPGIDGVTVRLLDDSGVEIAAQVTSGGGLYSFTGLDAGTYTVVVDPSTLPAATSTPSFDLDGTATPNEATVTAEIGIPRNDVDFGYRGFASIGDFVWLDLDGDGVQDADEPGLDGVTVSLLDENGVEIATQVTSGGGLYSFTDLVPGTYSVAVDATTLPAGTGDATFDLDGIDSLNIATVTVVAGETQNDVDFGYAPVPGEDCVEGTYRDDFTQQSFGNQDGTLLWTGDWVEDDPVADGPFSGQVEIHDGLLTLEDRPNTGGEPGVVREADLSGATHATLNFRFLTSYGVDADDAITVDVSNDGGATWNVLEVITGIHGEVDEERSFDITAFASENTQVRFRVTNKYGGKNEVFCLDYVEIVKACGDCIAREVRDDFDQREYTNNDGPNAWASAWTEVDPLGAGPRAGAVQVDHGGGLLTFNLEETASEPSIAREVNLSGATGARLSFEVITSSKVDVTDSFLVEVSSDGGATWTVVDTVDGIDGYGTFSFSYDISAFASDRTVVRFRVPEGAYQGWGEAFCIEFVEIVSICEGDTFLGQLGGVVWNDINGNGVIEDASNGVGGVTVDLRQGGSTVATATTDHDGRYLFDDLEAGSYTVAVNGSTLPANLDEATFDIDGVSSLNEATLGLGEGEDRNDVNFGYRAGSSAPCTSCDHYTGYLDYTGDKDWQPDGNYFYSDSGTIQAWLEGEGSDFDLYLFKWNGWDWVQVKKSINDGTSSEHINYSGSAGYYIVKVHSWHGHGAYDFYLSAH
ncbi:MAG: SdrD B-like domain-containing protein [Acidobacteriota bacterium]